MTATPIYGGLAPCALGLLPLCEIIGGLGPRQQTVLSLYMVFWPVALKSCAGKKIEEAREPFALRRRLPQRVGTWR